MRSTEARELEHGTKRGIGPDKGTEIREPVVRGIVCRWRRVTGEAYGGPGEYTNEPDGEPSSQAGESRNGVRAGAVAEM